MQIPERYRENQEHHLSKDQRSTLLRGYRILKDELNIKIDKNIQPLRTIIVADPELSSDAIDSITDFFGECGLSLTELGELADFCDSVEKNNARKLIAIRKERWFFEKLYEEICRKREGAQTFDPEQREATFVRIEKRCQYLSTLLRMTIELHVIGVMENTVLGEESSL